ncbi:hypothetical protein AWB78_02744 [Caballeronia calidae]|uniref:Purine nucleoside phosphorylase n=1 Tax=Caballeronia calidae TaxID=1777139 RepID=A0A158BIT8_9BURK|nr:hypothetical protein [Caballeronia calidae]SAK69982.1 hypothetical protein AWB78_02744 [Caballeronia calidae]
MKKILAALLAFTALVPMLSYAQSVAPVIRAEANGQVAQTQRDGSLHQSGAHYADRVYDREYGASTDSTAQSGWTTQPSAQALGQRLYMHH